MRKAREERYEWRRYQIIDGCRQLFSRRWRITWQRHAISLARELAELLLSIATKPAATISRRRIEAVLCALRWSIRPRNMINSTATAVLVALISFFAALVLLG